MPQDFFCLIELYDSSVLYKADLVCTFDSLIHIMGDKYDGLMKTLLQLDNFILQFSPGHRSRDGKRLVHEDNIRIGRKGTGDSHTLFLSPESCAGKLLRKVSGSRFTISSTSSTGPESCRTAYPLFPAAD